MWRPRVTPVLVGMALALPACASGGATGTSTDTSSASQDSFGDPYITNAQGASIRIGSSARAAFKGLGGKANSGSTGGQAGPVLGYDYPIRGTGNPDDVSDTKTIWWQICVGHGRVLSKQRGTMDSLDAFCPGDSG